MFARRDTLFPVSYHSLRKRSRIRISKDINTHTYCLDVLSTIIVYWRIHILADIGAVCLEESCKCFERFERLEATGRSQ